MASTDALAHVGSSRTWDDALEEHVYSRVRGDVPFEVDQITIFVSTESHRMGPGIVERIHAVWDRTGADMPDVEWISEERARELAIEAVGSDTTGERAWTERRIICGGVGAPDAMERACRALWIVHSTDPELVAANLPDAAVLDGATGEVTARETFARNYSGTLRATSTMPYEPSSTFRGLSRARLHGSGGASVYLGINGGYTNFTPSTSTGTIGLENVGFGVPGEIWRTEDYDCLAPVAADYRTFTLGGTDDLAIASSDVTTLRTDWNHWHSLQWAFRAVAGLNNFIQADDQLAYSTGHNVGGGGQRLACGNHVMITAASWSDTNAYDPEERGIVLHEFGHFLNDCTRGWSPGCPGELTGQRTMLPETMSHGLSDAFAAWATSYEDNGYARSGLSALRFNGIGDPTDIMLHESEIDGTDPPGMVNECRIAGVFQCNVATEACYDDAHDHPRCLRRAADLAGCLALFPSVPDPYLEWAPYGTDPSHPGGGIGICKADGYTNGVAPEVLLADFAHLRGYYGVADLIATNRNLTHWTEIAVNPDEPANTLHDIAALRSPRFTTSRSIHHLSTESFAWLDDVADYAAVAEIARIARGSLVTQTNGGTTGTGLRFNTSTDIDAFMLSVPPGEQYTVTASTSSTSIDLCVTIVREIDGAAVGTSTGCGDGTGNRNATFTISAGNYSRYVAYVTNVLGIANVGTYTLAVQTINDDYVDTIARAVGSRPLREGGSEAGNIDGITDADLFHYDYPPTAGAGALTFSLTTAITPTPTLNVYFSADETIPSSTIATSSTGSVSIASPTVGRYYVQVVNAGITYSGYTIGVSAGTCFGTCSGSGSFASPRPLPTLEGGEIVDRLSTFDPAWHSTGCQNGTDCDWFRVDLAANERFSVTSYGVLPGGTCDLELAIFTPDDLDGDDYWHPDSTRYPAVVDSGGSPDTANGGQLTFVARRSGRHRIAVRANGTGTCTRYYLDVRRMAADTGSYAPPAYTW